MKKSRGIPPVHSDKIPPAGSEPAGVTLDGSRQLFKVTRKKANIVPKTLPDGEPEFRTSPLNGARLHPINLVADIYDEVSTVYLESEGNTNIRKIKYRAPTPQELEALRRKKMVEDSGTEFLARLMETGLTPTEIMARVRGEQAASSEVAEPAGQGAPEPVNEIDYSQFPKYIPVGKWELSDGRIVEGKKPEAIEAEDALRVVREAKAEAELNAMLLIED